MISLGSIPSFVDIADATFAADQPVKGSVMAQLAANAKFAMVRRETFMVKATHGQTILPPQSAIDGYQYSYPEITFWWTRDASWNVGTKLPSGGGCILEWVDDVSAAGVVSVATNYFIDGGADTPTNDGELCVYLFCQRNAGLRLGAVPTWADIEDGDLAGGEAPLASVLAQLNNNIRYACVRKEFFVQKLYHGQSIAPCVSPVDGYTYALENQAAIAPPPAPTLSQVLDGALEASSYNIQTTLVNPAGETTPSPAAQLSVAADNVPHVASPAASGNATAYNVYAGDGPATPVPGQVASGSLAVRTEFYRIAYVTPTGITSSSVEASIALAAGHVATIPSPAAAGTATGYNVYGGAATGTEELQNAAPIPLGTLWQEPDGGLIAGAGAPDGPTLQNPVPIALGTDWQLDPAALVHGAVPPVANSTAMSEMHFLPSMISSLPAGGVPSGSGTVRQFGCVIGGMPTVTNPATFGQIASFVNYYVNGGALTPTNDGAILVLIACTRERGNRPIPPAVRVQPPAATTTSFGALALPPGGTIGGFPIKGVGNTSTGQILDINGETQNDLLYARHSPVITAAITPSSNLSSGQKVGGDSGVGAYGGGGDLGLGGTPGLGLDVFAGNIRAQIGSGGANIFITDNASGGVEVRLNSLGGVLSEYRAGGIVRTNNSVGTAFQGTASTDNFELYGNGGALRSATPYWRLHDTAAGGVEAYTQSESGALIEVRAGSIRRVINAIGHGFDRTPTTQTVEAGGSFAAQATSPFYIANDTAVGGRSALLSSNSGNLDLALNGVRSFLGGTAGWGVDRVPSSYEFESAGDVANFGTSPAYVMDDTAPGGKAYFAASSGANYVIQDQSAGVARHQIGTGGQEAVAGSPGTEQLRVLGSGDAYHGGANAGVFMGDRSTGLDTGWYAAGGYKRLWDATFGDTLRADTGGNIGTAGITPGPGLWSPNMVAAMANAYMQCDDTTGGGHKYSWQSISTYAKLNDDTSAVVRAQMDASGAMGIGGVAGTGLEVFSTGGTIRATGTTCALFVSDRTIGGHENALYATGDELRLWHSVGGDLLHCNSAAEVGIGGSPVSGYKLSALGTGVIDSNVYMRASLGPHSTALNLQGSVSPVPFSGIAFAEYNTSSGEIDVKVTIAGTLYRPDGSTFAVPTSTTSFSAWAGQTVDLPPPPSDTSTNTSTFIGNICWDPNTNALVIQQVEADISDSAGVVTSHPSAMSAAQIASLAVADGLIPIIINAGVTLSTTGDGSGGGTNSDSGDSGRQPLSYL